MASKNHIKQNEKKKVSQLPRLSEPGSAEALVGVGGLGVRLFNSVTVPPREGLSEL
jgi:hypothetical protein